MLRTSACLVIGILAIAEAKSVSGTARVRAQTSPSTPAVSIGILREDSVLVPFAEFDGSTWTEGSVPERGEWELLRPTGSRQTIRTTGKTDFENHCESFVGLSTDYKSRV